MTVKRLIIFGKEGNQNPSLSSHMLACLVLLLLFSLSACGGSQFDKSSDKTRRIDTSNARTAKLDTNIGVNDMRKLAKPTSLQTDASSGAKTTNIRSQSGGELDIEPRTQLFSEKLNNEDERFRRLEMAVQDIQDDFNEISPAISRLVAIEEDIKELLGQLETLVNSGGLNSAPQRPSAQNSTRSTPQRSNDNDGEASQMPAMSNNNAVRTLATASASSDTPRQIQRSTRAEPKPAPQRMTSQPSKVSGGDAKVRIADHSNKTRLVFETANKSSFQTSFDKSEQLVTIDTRYNFSQSEVNRLARMSKRVSEATITPNGQGGQTLILLVQGVNSFSGGTHIAPNKDNPNHRFFIDMMR